MNEKMLTRIKKKLTEIFTNLIRIIQKHAKKLPDGKGKVAFLNLLKRAKEKLNKVDKITNQKMAEELKKDADDIEEAIQQTSKKYDVKYSKTIDKVKVDDDGNPTKSISNELRLRKMDRIERKSREFNKKYVSKESYNDDSLSFFEMLYA